MSPEQRAQVLEELIDSAWQILEARPDFPAILDWRDPVPADFWPKWKRAMEQYRKRTDDSD